MDLLCYLHPGWAPAIRPAEASRPWMDSTPEAFAYRCLPLNIANAHGWEILCPCDVETIWTGGGGTNDVIVRNSGPAARLGSAPVSLFGQATLTFHIEALFRTPPGWDLWVTGPPNRPKDAIYPLSAVVETDWSPYTFTMNWRFTRRNHWLRFREGEPICFIFPVRRGVLETVQPKTLPMEADPDLQEQFLAWSRSRTAFQQEMATCPAQNPSDKWQKRYYRGQPMPGGTPPEGHRTRLRLRPFTPGRPAPDEQKVELTEAALANLITACSGHPARSAAIHDALLQAGLSGVAAERLTRVAQQIPNAPDRIEEQVLEA